MQGLQIAKFVKIPLNIFEMFFEKDRNLSPEGEYPWHKPEEKHRNVIIKRLFSTKLMRVCKTFKMMFGNVFSKKHITVFLQHNNMPWQRHYKEKHKPGDYV